MVAITGSGCSWAGVCGTALGAGVAAAAGAGVGLIGGATASGAGFAAFLASLPPQPESMTTTAIKPAAVRVETGFKKSLISSNTAFIIPCFDDIPAGKAARDSPENQIKHLVLSIS